MAKSQPGRLDGQRFVFTGILPYGIVRARLEEFIEAEGGEVSTCVATTTSYLVVGHSRSGGPSAAEQKAARLNQTKAAAIGGNSTLTIQGTAGTTEKHIKYSPASTGANPSRRLRGDGPGAGEPRPASTPAPPDVAS